MRDTSCARGTLLSARLEQSRTYGVGRHCVCGPEVKQPGDPSARNRIAQKSPTVPDEVGTTTGAA